MKYLRIVKVVFWQFFWPFKSMLSHLQPEKSLKKAKILNLENQAMLLVETFLIHNSKTKIFPDKYSLQNARKKAILGCVVIYRHTIVNFKNHSSKCEDPKMKTTSTQIIIHSLYWLLIAITFKYHHYKCFFSHIHCVSSPWLIRSHIMCSQILWNKLFLFFQCCYVAK